MTQEICESSFINQSPLQLSSNLNHYILNIHELKTLSKNKYKLGINQQKLSVLKESIKKYGLLQPIIVLKKENSVFEVISGYMRLEACRALGFEEIPCRILENISDLEAEELYKNLHECQRELISQEKKDLTVSKNFSVSKAALPEYLL